MGDRGCLRNFFGLNLKVERGKKKVSKSMKQNKKDKAADPALWLQWAEDSGPTVATLIWPFKLSSGFMEVSEAGRKTPR